MSALTWGSQVFKDLFVGLLWISANSYIYYRKLKNISDLDLKILKFSQKFYSAETAKLCFEPIIADWKMEYSAAVSQKLNWQSRWISIRYVYAYLSAMFMQSRIGRLLQIIFKS